LSSAGRVFVGAAAVAAGAAAWRTAGITIADMADVLGGGAASGREPTSSAITNAPLMADTATTAMTVTTPAKTEPRPEGRAGDKV
jgi:hypothetical protein